MEVGSLFSGIGGIEIAFERQGFKTKWFIENEPYAKSILKKRFPNTTVYDDIKEVDFRTIPKVDILTGGFPCQDISNAGKRVGIKGSRSSLWKYYLKAIRQIQPKFAFIENVSALLNRGLHVVLADLAKIGYDAEWYCVPASAVGANHRRDRVFIIAYVPNTLCGRRDRQQCEKGIQEKTTIVSDTNERRKWKSQILWKYWSVEPKVGRVAYGIPNRVDRIKCLGNAVVPQVAEVFAQAIKEIVTLR